MILLPILKDKKPVKGDESLRYAWMGVQWQFSSKENLEEFKKQPQKFSRLNTEGYCAYASVNHNFTTDPNAWTIVDDKLYMNYNLKVKEIWSKDIPGRIQKAEQYWKTLEKESH